jgi:hypothetical protein
MKSFSQPAAHRPQPSLLAPTVSVATAVPRALVTTTSIELVTAPSIVLTTTPLLVTTTVLVTTGVLTTVCAGPLFTLAFPVALPMNIAGSMMPVSNTIQATTDSATNRVTKKVRRCEGLVRRGGRNLGKGERAGLWMCLLVS